MDPTPNITGVTGTRVFTESGAIAHIATAAAVPTAAMPARALAAEVAADEPAGITGTHGVTSTGLTGTHDVPGLDTTSYDRHRGVTGTHGVTDEHGITGTGLTGTHNVPGLDTVSTSRRGDDAAILGRDADLTSITEEPVVGGHHHRHHHGHGAAAVPATAVGVAGVSAALEGMEVGHHHKRGMGAGVGTAGMGTGMAGETIPETIQAAPLAVPHTLPAETPAAIEPTREQVRRDEGDLIGRERGPLRDNAIGGDRLRDTTAVDATTALDTASTDLPSGAESTFPGRTVTNETAAGTGVETTPGMGAGLGAGLGAAGVAGGMGAMGRTPEWERREPMHHLPGTAPGPIEPTREELREEEGVHKRGPLQKAKDALGIGHHGHHQHVPQEGYGGVGSTPITSGGFKESPEYLAEETAPRTTIPDATPVAPETVTPESIESKATTFEAPPAKAPRDAMLGGLEPAGVAEPISMANTGTGFTGSSGGYTAGGYPETGSGYTGTGIAGGYNESTGLQGQGGYAEGHHPGVVSRGIGKLADKVAASVAKDTGSTTMPGTTMPGSTTTY